MVIYMKITTSQEENIIQNFKIDVVIYVNEIIS